MKSLHLFKLCGFKLKHQSNDNLIHLEICVWCIALNISFLLVFFYLWIHYVITCIYTIRCSYALALNYLKTISFVRCGCQMTKYMFSVNVFLYLYNICLFWVPNKSNIPYSKFFGISLWQWSTSKWIVLNVCYSKQFRRF